jgi:hypothetical protein
MRLKRESIKKKLTHSAQRERATILVLIVMYWISNIFLSLLVFKFENKNEDYSNEILREKHL